MVVVCSVSEQSEPFCTDPKGHMAVSLKGLRHDKGLTARAAADTIGVALNTLLDAENRTTEPGVTNKHKIASFYDVKVTDIWPVKDPVR